MAIDHGDLNDILFCYLHDGDDTILLGFNFAWKRRPEHLIMQDEYGNDWDYYTTDLEDALALRDTKEICERQDSLIDIVWITTTDLKKYWLQNGVSHTKVTVDIIVHIL